MIEDSAYMQLMKSCSSWNFRLSKERSSLLPFWDAQTNTGQRPGNLWRTPEERIKPRSSDLAYSYPARRWRKRKRDTVLQGMPDFSADIPGSSEGHLISQVENPNARGFEEMLGLDHVRDFKPESVFTELEDMSDSVDDFEDHSDTDDYEETYVKKKKATKRKTPGGLHYTLGKDGKKRYFGGAAAALIPPEEKPYCCKHCGARYKSKPGLNYHLAHVHSDFGGISSNNCEVSHTPISVGVSGAVSSPAAGIPGLPASGAPPGTSMGKPEGGAAPSTFCDFCLGDTNENKKTGLPEELISCHDCGRSGHPSCHVPQFSTNMIISTKKYGWQCIECKSCAICGTSENDDQLLFCDDCDRGFHLYCLNPPLQAAPDGEWSCHLCQVEFGPNASAPAPQYLPSRNESENRNEQLLGNVKEELEQEEEPKSVEQ